MNWVFDVDWERNFVELVDEVVDIVASSWSWSLQFLRVGKMAGEATRTVGSVDPGTEDNGRALWHDVGVAGIGHRDLLVILGEVPYLARQLLVFNGQAYYG